LSNREKLKGNEITNEELLELPVDILVPSALENVITEKNMESVKAKIIIEMANGPVSPIAYEYLAQKGVVIIPDILANAGGVAASYLEWEQNKSGGIYSKDEVFAKLKGMMNEAFDKIYKIKEEKGLNYKEATYFLALEKLL
jgi:glutamate dehydrogenase/leucine dehydrogenase